MGKKGELIRWFSELKSRDSSIAGFKAANLAEMHNKKFQVPAGFVVTAEAYRQFIKHSGLQKNILDILHGLDMHNLSSLERGSFKIRKLIESAEMPKELSSAIIEAYEFLDAKKDNFSGASSGALDILRTGHEPPFVAVRSSAVANTDDKDLGFSGVHDSFLNVKGHDALLRTVKKSFASLFTARAINYRKKNGILDERSYCAVIIQKMIDSNKSGVMFSKNPIEEDGNILIEASWGLGNGIVRGKVSPDSYRINADLELVDRKISDKKVAFTRDSSGKTGAVNLSPEISKKEVLNGHELKILAQIAQSIEKHYGKPQEIEFAIDGDGVWLLQSLPMTSFARSTDSQLEGNILASGRPGSQGFATGTVKIVRDQEDLERIQLGNVVVLKNAGKKASDSLQKASAIVTDSGSVSSKAIVAAREMEIPAVVSALEATEKLQDGQRVTVDGHTGKIIEGDAVERKSDVKPVLETKTNFKLILNSADYARRASDSGIKEIGLVKLDSLIANTGKHVVWYIKNNKLGHLTGVLSEDLRSMSVPFDKIWIKTSDVLSNKYRNLEGASDNFEENPLMGDHGIRFGLKNQDLLESELRVVKEVSDEFSEKKFGILLPNVTSVKEVKAVKEIFSDMGMPNNVKLGIMIDTPASVQVINDLCDAGIQIVNFNLKRLTQHTLAVDHGNENIKDLYDETNPAILNSISYVLRRCKKHNVETAACWGSNTNPILAKFLVQNQIGGICVEPDKAQEVSGYFSNAEAGFSLESTLEKRDEKIDDEEAVLKALGNGNGNREDYNPSILEEKSKKDIPNLNEAIPVSSEHFEDKKINEIDMQEELEPEQPDPEPDPKNPEPGQPEPEHPEPRQPEPEQEEIEIPFEAEEDAVTMMEAQQEIQNSELREQAIKQQLGQATNLFGQKGEVPTGDGEEGEEEDKEKEDDQKEEKLDIF